MMQSGGFLGRSFLIPLELTAAASAADAGIHDLVNIIQH